MCLRLVALLELSILGRDALGRILEHALGLVSSFGKREPRIGAKGEPLQLAIDARQYLERLPATIGDPNAEPWRELVPIVGLACAGTMRLLLCKNLSVSLARGIGNPSAR